MIGGTGKMSFISCERGSKANFRWKQKNKDNNGEQVNREHKTTNFRWGGGGVGGVGQGNTPLYFRGTWGPHYFWRSSRMYRLLNTSKHNKYSIEAPRGSMLH